MHPELIIQITEHYIWRLRSALQSKSFWVSPFTSVTAVYNIMSYRRRWISQKDFSID